jgi:uncharacterized pyridoxamine 5'-phosphate oxidase family protein
MHETADDLRALQALLDSSYERAGAHLKTIHTPERRVHAQDLSDILRGVRVLNLATVTASCEPRVGPVDGLFYRGHFWFGSAENSVRFRHLRARPQCSGSHVVGETFAVIVHGRATEVNVADEEHAGFKAMIYEVYPDWDDWYSGDPPPYARIEATALFAYAFEPSVLEELRRAGI